MSLKNKSTSFAVKVVVNYILDDPEKGIEKALEWVDKFDKNDEWLPKRKVFHEILDDKNGVWYNYIMNLFKEVDHSVIVKIFENFIVNATLEGMAKQKAFKEEHGCNVPWAILMDPTSACNLNCTGCWAADYGHKLNLSYEELDNIVEQANEMGTYMFIFSGGEPLVRKADIIKLCQEHQDCMFLAFTNGTLIDDKFASDMLAVKNFIPAISIEGFEEDTDFRRGNGTYKKVINAMEILKKKKLPFGISCCYTSKNVDVIGSDEYFDSMINMGAKFAWFFTYMPIGKGAVPELMATASQREEMYHRIRAARKTKPLFTMDFWNDGEYVNGCIAGGRYYLHINANGDIEPCAFIHYSDSNIRKDTLLEAYKKPLFSAYKNGQPFNNNHLRPCPLLDNPEKLEEMVTSSGAVSTDMEEPEDVKTLCSKCKDVSQQWAEVAEKLWKETKNK